MLMKPLVKSLIDDHVICVYKTTRARLTRTYRKFYAENAGGQNLHTTKMLPCPRHRKTPYHADVI